MAVVANPGSALGEAVGALIEREVNRVLAPIAEENGCVYVKAGRPNPRTGHPTKLLLTDSAGNEYNIDSVIANERMQPLVLIESKYIRYKKHNRDKGSWICTAHYSLRRRYPTIRESIAILAGSWSGSAKAMMRSFDVSLFKVGFSRIVAVLSKYQVDFAWGEKEREKAMAAWQNWQGLTDAQFDLIARELLADIDPELREALKDTLDTAVPRKIRSVEVTVETHLGETRRFSFRSVGAALEFLDGLDESELMENQSGPALWETASEPEAD